jgi:hypothetical protein
LFAKPELLDCTALKIEHLQSPICREVFRAQQFLRDKALVINAITVYEYLKTQSLPEDLKSFARVAEIENQPICADVWVLRSYERIIISAWRVRHLAACHCKAQIALADGEDPVEVQAKFERDAEAALEAGCNGLKFRSPREICESAPAKTQFIWEGYIAPGCITEISGAAKRSGKTTLQLSLVRHILDGKAFLGLRTRQTNVLQKPFIRPSLLPTIDFASCSGRTRAASRGLKSFGRRCASVGASRQACCLSIRSLNLHSYLVIPRRMMVTLGNF